MCHLLVYQCLDPMELSLYVSSSLAPVVSLILAEDPVVSGPLLGLVLNAQFGLSLLPLQVAQFPHHTGLHAERQTRCA